MTIIIFLFLSGFMDMSNALPRKVAMIESFTPTAIMAVVLTKMFDLNDDLSNAA
jgi:predicted permease